MGILTGKKSNGLFIVILALTIWIVIQPLSFEVVEAETATGSKVTYKGAVSSMGSTCGKFSIKGRDAFCAEHPKATPPTGTKITSTKLITNSTMRKALYYGYGGPKAKVSKNNAGWVSTSIALSRANGKGGGTIAAQKFYKSLAGYLTPPDSFKVYYCKTSGGKQALCYWIYEPEGKVRVKKQSTDSNATSSRGYSLSGAVYGVYKSKSCTSGNRVAKLTTGTSGISGKITLDKGTYYIKEMTAPKGFSLSSTIYTVAITDQCDKTVTVKDAPKKGKIQLIKSSDNPDVTDNNSAYSLSGAKYGVWSDSSLKKRVGTLTTKSTGSSNVISVWPGTYYVKEVAAPKGYMKDDTIHKVTVTGDNFANTKTLRVKDSPESDPAWVIIQKIDAESGEAISSGNHDMGGAEFTVKYYEGTEWNSDPAESGAEVKRKWSFETNESGYICLVDNEYFVSGDELYYNDLGNPTIPKGTITIQETKSPEGYEINDEIFIVNINVDDNEPGISLSQIPTTVVKEQPIRGDIEIVKKDSKTGESLKGVSFDLIDVLSNEVVATLVTDENGYATTASEENPNGRLPYGEYIVREKEPPIGYLPMEEDISVAISKNKEKILLEIENTPAEIKTSAIFKENGLKIINIDDMITIVDEVTFKNLIPGQEYRLEGVLMDTSSEEPLMLDGKKVISSMNFIPESDEGIVEMEFDLNGETLAGKSVTVFEELYIDEIKVASHTEIRDVEQTVEFLGASKIRTTAYFGENEDKEIAPQESVTIIDKVTFENLIPGQEYKLEGILMDTETEQPLLIGGEEIRSVIEFVPDTYEGALMMEFTLNAETLSGKYVTVFEELYLGDTKVARHADINDSKQTVKFKALGDIEIYKGDGLTGQPLEGVKFQVIDKLTGDVEVTLVTDELGFATTAKEDSIEGSLELGKYIIRETEPLPGYEPIEDIEIVLDDFNRIMSVQIDNMPLQMSEDVSDTGDPMGRVVWLSIALLLISFMGAIVSVKRKEE